MGRSIISVACFAMMMERKMLRSQRIWCRTPWSGKARPGGARLISARTLLSLIRIGARPLVGLILASVIAGIHSGVVLFSGPWPPLVTLRHWLAAPNCTAARMVGLAPARRGEPGYYWTHDRDQDGLACEDWPRRGPGTYNRAVSYPTVTYPSHSE